MSSSSQTSPQSSPPAQTARAGEGGLRLRRGISLLLLALLVLAGGVWRYRVTRPEYRFARGEQAVRAGEIEVAHAYADRLDAAGSPDHAAILRAEILLRSGSADRALAQLTHVHAKGTLRLRADLLTGKCLLELGAIREADRLFREIVAEQPDEVDAHRGLAVIAYDLGSLDEAVGHLRRIAELDPTDARPHRLIGLIYKDMARYELAETAYREALRRGLTSVVEGEVRLELAEVLARQAKFAEGLEVLNGGQSVEAENPAASATRAECLRGLGRQPEAATVLDQSLARHPTAALYRLRGQVHQDKGNQAEALKCFEKAVELAPADHQSYYLLGQAYAGLGRKEDAARAFARVEALHKELDRITALTKEAMQKPWDPAVRLQLAELSDRMGKPELAAMWRKAAAVCAKETH